MVLTAGAYVNDENIGFFLQLTVIQFLCSFEKINSVLRVFVLISIVAKHIFQDLSRIKRKRLRFLAVLWLTVNPRSLTPHGDPQTVEQHKLQKSTKRSGHEQN